MKLPVNLLCVLRSTVTERYSGNHNYPLILNLFTPNESDFTLHNVMFDD